MKVIILSAILVRHRGHSEQASEQGLHTEKKEETHAFSQNEMSPTSMHESNSPMEAVAYSKSDGKEAILQRLQIQSILCRHVNFHLCHLRGQSSFPSSPEF